MEPTAGRAGREAPKPPAMTPVVGARFTRVVHREWGRSTVRPLASALSWLRFVLFFLFSLVFQFVHSIRFVRHSFFGSRKEPRIHITILHGSGVWCSCPELSGYHGDKGRAQCYCWDAALGNASNGGKTYFALAACGERSGYFARQDQRQGYERRT